MHRVTHRLVTTATLTTIALVSVVSCGNDSSTGSPTTPTPPSDQADIWGTIVDGTGSPVGNVDVAVATTGTQTTADGLFVMIMTGMEFDVWGLVAGFGFYAMFCIPLVALLFETGFHGSLVTVGLMFLPRVGLLYAVGALQPELFP